MSIPSDLPTELIVVDNGSRGAVDAGECPHLPVRRVREPARGQSRARNAGMAAARGDVLLWTDDDCHVPSDWVERMARPILDNAFDAVAGGVRLPEALERPWMTPLHRRWLGCTRELDPVHPVAMVGAAMGFRREIARDLGPFDPELGPGALGFGDDTLWSLRLRHAGWKLVAALDAPVEHYFDPSRLSRAAWLDRALRAGASEAWIHRHWFAQTIAPAALFAIKRRLRLAWTRARLPHSATADEGASEQELILLRDIGFYRRMAIETFRPARYLAAERERIPEAG